jgi:nucleoside-diphosphate-sugar epimerase
MADPVPPRKVFVTGARGFIGAALVRRLREIGSEVGGVDLEPGDDTAIVRGDVTAPGEWQEHAAGCDLVVHTAAVVGMYSSPEGYWQGNVLAPRLALDAAVAGGAQRFVHLSSIVVFGFDFEGEVDERTPVRPMGVHYVDTKIASEQTVLAAHADGEVPCTIVRPGDVYGPRSRPWTIEPVSLLRAGRLVLPAGGRGLLSPVFLDDLVEGVLRAATAPEAAGRIFTLSGGKEVTTAVFVGHLSAMLGLPPPRSVPTPLARAGARVLDAAARLRGTRNEVTPATVDYLARRGTYSIARARAVLGYEPAVDLPEGMRRTEAWLRSAGLLQG